MKLDRSLFALIIVTVNAGIGYFATLLTLGFGDNKYVPPTILFLDILGNALMVYLMTEKAAAAP